MRKVGHESKKIMEKLNPLQWCKFIFEFTGGDTHPVASFILTSLIFLLFGVLVWRAGSVQYRKDKSNAAPTQIRPATGNATTSAPRSPAVTGNGNTVVYDDSGKVDDKKLKPRD